MEQIRFTGLLNCYLFCILFRAVDCFQLVYVKSDSICVQNNLVWESSLEIMLKSLQNNRISVVKASLKIYPNSHHSETFWGNCQKASSPLTKYSYAVTTNNYHTSPKGKDQNKNSQSMSLFSYTACSFQTFQPCGYSLYKSKMAACILWASLLLLNGALSGQMQRKSSKKRTKA